MFQISTIAVTGETVSRGGASEFLITRRDAGFALNGEIERLVSGCLLCGQDLLGNGARETGLTGNTVPTEELKREMRNPVSKMLAYGSFRLATHRKRLGQPLYY